VSVARATRARAVLRVEVGGALNLVGALVKYLSLAFAFPVAVALVYGDSPWNFVLAGVATFAAGYGLERFTEGKETIGTREGFLVVSLTWLAAAFLLSLPYVLSGDEQISGLLNAYFESMSGMTTTGATVLTHVEALSQSLAMWRQFTQWIGGMGIIVLALAILPRLRVGGRQLLESELPGPDVERLTASIRTVARRLWLLYVGLTALAIAVLALIGWTGLDDRMTFYDAAAHAFTTLPTGGFSTHARSIEFFGGATQWAITAFMLVAGVNFALIY
jgi:trk/ktr system potassium uptake protein